MIESSNDKNLDKIARLNTLVTRIDSQLILCHNIALKYLPIFKNYFEQVKFNASTTSDDAFNYIIKNTVSPNITEKFESSTPLQNIYLIFMKAYSFHKIIEDFNNSIKKISEIKASLEIKKLLDEIEKSLDHEISKLNLTDEDYDFKNVFTHYILLIFNLCKLKHQILLELVKFPVTHTEKIISDANILSDTVNASNTISTASSNSQAENSSNILDDSNHKSASRENLIMKIHMKIFDRETKLRKIKDNIINNKLIPEYTQLEKANINEFKDYLVLIRKIIDYNLRYVRHSFITISEYDKILSWKNENFFFTKIISDVQNSITTLKSLDTDNLECIELGKKIINSTTSEIELDEIYKKLV